MYFSDSFARRRRASTLVRIRSTAVGFDFGVVALGGEHFVFGPSGATALLSADLGDALRLFAQAPEPLGFQPLDEHAARQKTV